MKKETGGSRMNKDVFALLLAASLVPAAAVAMDHSVMPHPAKVALAVGATLDGNGRIWLAKVENQQLWVSWSNDDGQRFSRPVAVALEPEDIGASAENRPKIAVAQDGTVLLSWSQSLPKRFTGNIRFARSIDGGRSFSVPITLNDDGRIGSHSFDSLAIDGAGRVAVVWLDGRDRDAAREKDAAFAGSSVYFAQSLDNGAHFSPNRKLTEHTCECCRTSLAWTAEGPIALWRNLYGTNTRDFALANLGTGKVRRATDDEWQIDACPHHGGGLAVDGHDALHLVWFTQGKTRQGLFYKRIAGGRESSPMALGDPAAQAGHATVAAAGSMVLITWREFDGRVYVARAMHSTDGGASWSAPLRLAESGGAADYPLPLTDGKQALVVWNSATEGVRILPLDVGNAK
ncbi:MAG: exo-alpha-sialidase [Deltaproteobacteria bacterium]|nr:exo-alpha-sialidase [Deltaproteobacteria bacterium]